MSFLLLEIVQVDGALSHEVVLAVEIFVVNGDFEHFGLVGKCVEVELLVPLRVEGLRYYFTSVLLVSKLELHVRIAKTVLVLAFQVLAFDQDHIHHAVPLLRLLLFEHLTGRAHNSRCLASFAE